MLRYPMRSSPYFIHMRPVYGEALRYHGRRFRGLSYSVSNFSGYFFPNHWEWHFFAPQSPRKILSSQIHFWFCLRLMSTFFNAIKSIIGVGSQEQMVWTHARRIVAFMQDQHSCGDRSIGHFPRVPVRENPFLVRFGKGVSKPAVAFPVDARLPHPAIICFFNFAPKSAVYNAEISG